MTREEMATHVLAITEQLSAAHVMFSNYAEQSRLLRDQVAAVHAILADPDSAQVEHATLLQSAKDLQIASNRLSVLAMATIALVD